MSNEEKLRIKSLYHSFLVPVLNILVSMLIASLKICHLFVQVPLDLAPTLSHSCCINEPFCQSSTLLEMSLALDPIY